MDTDQPDPEAATEFYGELFGWDFQDRMPADQPGQYFVGQLRGLDVAGVGSRADGADWPPAWNTYISVSSADDAAAGAKKAGGEVLVDSFDVGEAGSDGRARRSAGRRVQRLGGPASTRGRRW